MITFLITLLCVSILFMITVLNYWRIERMAHNQREFVEQARKEINALNTILLFGSETNRGWSRSSCSKSLSE